MVPTRRPARSVARCGAIAAALLTPFLLAATRGQSSLPPTHYSLVDFSLLLGSHHDGSVSIASMNRSGQVAGYLEYADAKTTQGADRAFVWRDGRVTWLPPLPGFSHSAALAQNQEGVVVGKVRSDWRVGQVPSRWRMARVGGRSEDAGSGTRACEWVNGRPRLLGTGHSGNSVAMAINARGDVVGGYSTPSSHGHDDHACLWRYGGGFLDLGPVVGLPARERGTGWVATSINSQGEVWGRVTGANVGQAGPTRVFWKKGRARPATPQDEQRMAEVRNRRGQVLRGSELVSGGQATPLLWKGRAAFGSDLNDLGDVVGGMPAIKLNLGPFVQRSDYDSHAFLYRAGRMYDLNDLVSQGAGEVLTQAVNIDDAGRILVWGRNRPLLLFPSHG